MKKVLLTATVQSHICQFHKPLAKMLQEHGYEVHVAARNNLAEKNGLEMEYVDRIYDVSFERFPFSLKNLAAYREIKRILKENKYDVIHTNTPVASVVTRIAARKYRKTGTKVFYTAHGFHFHDGAPIKNWLLYYPVEKLMSYWTDTLITINREDFKRAKENFKAKQIEYMPGVGVDLSKFDFEFSDEQKAKKRTEIGVPKDAFLMMSVGELNRNKNHEVIIRALKRLNNPDVHYCIAGNGPLKDHLIHIANELGVGRQVHLLGYRRDVPELYKSADVCCFPSIREGLGLAALEAMASGIVVLAADNRGTRDYVLDGENGFRCQDSDEACFAEKMKTLMDSPVLRHELGCKAMKKAEEFSNDGATAVLKKLYQ